MIFLAWNVWFYVGNPPSWVNWTAILIALLIAGYYAWRAEHIRLIPKVEIVDWHIEKESSDQNDFTVCQIVPKCLTESPVYECVGHLTELRRWAVDRWEKTSLTPQILRWAHQPYGPAELHPGAENFLSICAIGQSNYQVHPAIEASLSTTHLVSIFQRRQPGEIEAYQFDICVTYSHRVNGILESVKPVDVCLEVRLEDETHTPKLILHRR